MIALITNSIQPYCFDAARVLGLPEGAAHRFRYRRKWIDPKINVADLKGERSIIVLRNFDEATFIALRSATISDVLVLGETIYLEFVVEHYWTTAFCSRFESDLNRTLKTRGIKNTPKQHLESLAIKIDDFKDEKLPNQEFNQQIALWDKTSAMLGALPAFKDYSFFKLISVKSIAGKGTSLVPGDSLGKKAFGVLPLTSYSLELFQRIPWEINKNEQIAAPYTVQISSPDSDLAIRKGIQKIVGKYDVLKFLIVTPDVNSERIVTIDFQTKDGQDVDSHAPFLSISLKILPSWWRRFFTFLQLVAGPMGVVLMWFAVDLGKLFNWSPDIFRAFAALLIVFSTGKWDKFLEKMLDPAKDVKSSFLKS